MKPHTPPESLGLTVFLYVCTSQLLHCLQQLLQAIPFARWCWWPGRMRRYHLLCEYSIKRPQHSQHVLNLHVSFRSDAVSVATRERITSTTSASTTTPTLAIAVVITTSARLAPTVPPSAILGQLTCTLFVYSIVVSDIFRANLQYMLSHLRHRLHAFGN